MVMDWGYIAGFFDGEGSIVPIYPGGKSYRVSFAQTTKEVLELIAEYLEQYGIHTWITTKKPSKQYPNNIGYHLAFSKSTGVRLFLEAIEDKVIVKKKLVVEVLENLTTKSVTQVSDEERWDMVAMWNEGNGLSRSGIGFLLNRSSGTISINLRKGLGLL